MFVLLKRVRAWRTEMLVRGVFSPAELVELEDHLLEEAGRLVEEGRSDSDAFIEATRRMGTDEELATEYRLSHELGGAPAGTWVTKLVLWGVFLGRWVQGLFVFCLPGLLMAVPGLMLSGLAWEGGLRWNEYASGVEVPAATSWAWMAMAFMSAHSWWVLPLVLAVLLWPTVYRIRQLRDQTDSNTVAILAEDMAEARPLLLMGVVAYPLTGGILTQIAFGPLFRIIDMLGG